MQVLPDMTVVGKIMGGGAPIAAFGGNEDVMAVLAPTGGTFTGGTHGGNPFCVGMAHRVLDLLEAHPEYYDQMRRLAERLAGGIRAIFRECDLPYAVVQHESIVDFKFRPGPPNRDYDDALAADKEKYAEYWHAMLDRGILLATESKRSDVRLHRAQRRGYRRDPSRNAGALLFVVAPTQYAIAWLRD